MANTSHKSIVNIKKRVTLGQLLEFEVAFPNEEPLTVEEYLKGGSRKLILTAASIFLGFKSQNSKYDDNKELLGALFCRKIIEEYPELGKLADTFLGDQKNEVIEEYIKSLNNSITSSIEASRVPADSVPLYDIDINAGNIQRLIDDNNSVPLFGWLHLDDDSTSTELIGVRTEGDSMASFINGGDVILIRRIEDREFIPSGHAYVVIGNELSVVKYIRNGSTPDKWTLRSHNENYEDFEISKAAVKHLFIVVKVLKELTY